MLIRDAVDADADAVATIHHRGWVETYRGLLPDPYLDELTLEACLARWRAGMTGASRAQTVAAMIAAGVGARVTLPVGGRVDMPSIGLKGEPRA